MKSIPMFSATFLLLSFTGCGEVVDTPDVYPVSGSVMYKGKVVEGATVSFWTKDAPRAATGVTDAEGKFQLTTFEPNDGAMAGEHVVLVSKMEEGAAAASDEQMMNDPSAMIQMSQDAQGAKGPKSLIPEKYSKRPGSPLTETVKAEGENKFPLQLTD